MPLLYDAQYWRERAEEARTIAETMVSFNGRQVMLETALNYDRMAALSDACAQARQRSEPETAASR